MIQDQMQGRNAKGLAAAQLQKQLSGLQSQSLGGRYKPTTSSQNGLASEKMLGDLDELLAANDAKSTRNVFENDQDHLKYQMQTSSTPQQTHDESRDTHEVQKHAQHLRPAQKDVGRGQDHLMSSNSLGQDASTSFLMQNMAGAGHKPSNTNITRQSSRTYTNSNLNLNMQHFMARQSQGSLEKPTIEQSQRSATMTPGELLAQREELKRLETDLELRYRKLQDFAQSQLGSMNDVIADTLIQKSEGPAAKDDNLDFAKDIKSEDHHYSKFQLKQMEPPQSEQHGKKARNAIHGVASNRDHRNQSEAPSQPSARGDDVSYTQNTQTGRQTGGRCSQERQQNRNRPNIVEMHELNDGSELHPHSQPRRQQQSNMQVSSSQTEYEANDLGIGYDKGTCPRDLAFEDGLSKDSLKASRSNACSQSQQQCSSPSYQSKNGQGAPASSLEVQQDMGQDAKSKPEKRNAAVMLLRAQAGIARAASPYNEEVSNFESRGHEEVRDQNSAETSKFNTKQTSNWVSHQDGQAALDDSTRVAEKAKPAATRLDGGQPRELTGEQRLQAELQRIEQERKLIIAYLPKNYLRDASPSNPDGLVNLAARPLAETQKLPDNTYQQLSQHQAKTPKQPAMGHQRDLSNSSFGRAYALDLNLSSRFGRQVKEQLTSFGKSSSGNKYSGHKQWQLDRGSQENGARDQSGSQGAGAQAIHEFSYGQPASHNRREATSADYGHFKNSTINRPYVAQTQAHIDINVRRVVEHGDQIDKTPKDSRNVAYQSQYKPELQQKSRNAQHTDVTLGGERPRTLDYSRASSGAHDWSTAYPSHLHAQNQPQSQPQPWRIERVNRQPGATAGLIDAHPDHSQERIFRNYQEIRRNLELNGRSQSREPDAFRAHSPAEGRQPGPGVSPYSKSTRQTDLQNSGLALLKKTTALLKNPPAVTNYKALNFDLDGQAYDVSYDAKASEDPEDQRYHGLGPRPATNQSVSQYAESESLGARDYNNNRKGFILQLVKKNGGVEEDQRSPTDFNIGQRNGIQKYVGSRGGSISRERPRDTSPMLPERVLESKGSRRQHGLNAAHEKPTMRASSPRSDIGQYGKAARSNIQINQERSISHHRRNLEDYTRSKEQPALDIDQKSAEQKTESAMHGKLNFQFMRRLRGGNTDKAAEVRKQEFVENRADDAGRPKDRRSPSAGEYKDDEARAGTEEADQLTQLQRSTSKIDRLKKLERELEGQRSGIEVMRRPETAKPADTTRTGDEQSRERRTEKSKDARARLHRAPEEQPNSHGSGAIPEAEQRAKSIEQRLLKVRELENKNQMLEEQILKRQWKASLKAQQSAQSESEAQLMKKDMKGVLSQRGPTAQPPHSAAVRPLHGMHLQTSQERSRSSLQRSSAPETEQSNKQSVFTLGHNPNLQGAASPESSPPELVDQFVVDNSVQQYRPKFTNNISNTMHPSEYSSFSAHPAQPNERKPINPDAAFKFTSDAHKVDHRQDGRGGPFQRSLLHEEARYQHSSSTHLLPPSTFPFQQSSTTEQQRMPSHIHWQRAPGTQPGRAPEVCEDSFGRRRNSSEEGQYQSKAAQNIMRSQAAKTRAKSHLDEFRQGNEATHRSAILMEGKYKQRLEEIPRGEQHGRRKSPELSPRAEENRSRSNMSRPDLLPSRGPPSVPKQQDLVEQSQEQQNSKAGSGYYEARRAVGTADEEARARRIEQIRRNQRMLQEQARQLHETSMERYKHSKPQSVSQVKQQRQFMLPEHLEQGEKQAEPQIQIGQIRGEKQDELNRGDMQPESFRILRRDPSGAVVRQPAMKDASPHYANGGAQQPPRDSSPATILGMDLKSSFAQKKLEAGSFEHRSSHKKATDFRNLHDAVDNTNMPRPPISSFDNVTANYNGTGTFENAATGPTVPANNAKQIYPFENQIRSFDRGFNPEVMERTDAAAAQGLANRIREADQCVDADGSLRRASTQLPTPFLPSGSGGQNVVSINPRSRSSEQVQPLAGGQPATEQERPLIAQSMSSQFPRPNAATDAAADDGWHGQSKTMDARKSNHRVRHQDLADRYLQQIGLDHQDLQMQGQQSQWIPGAIHQDAQQVQRPGPPTNALSSMHANPMTQHNEKDTSMQGTRAEQASSRPYVESSVGGRGESIQSNCLIQAQTPTKRETATHHLGQLAPDQHLPRGEEDRAHGLAKDDCKNLDAHKDTSQAAAQADPGSNDNALRASTIQKQGSRVQMPTTDRGSLLREYRNDESNSIFDDQSRAKSSTHQSQKRQTQVADAAVQKSQDDIQVPDDQSHLELNKSLGSVMQSALRNEMMNRDSEPRCGGMEGSEQQSAHPQHHHAGQPALEDTILKDAVVQEQDLQAAGETSKQVEQELQHQQRAGPAEGSEHAQLGSQRRTGPASAKAPSRDEAHKPKSKRPSLKVAGAKSGTQHRSKRSDPKSHDELRQQLWNENDEPKTDNMDVKKLISMQFERAQMLMDLQKQFLDVQEIEKANEVHSAEPVVGAGTALSSGRHAEAMQPSAKRRGDAEVSSFIDTQLNKENDGHVVAQEAQEGSQMAGPHSATSKEPIEKQQNLKSSHSSKSIAKQSSKNDITARSANEVVSIRSEREQHVAVEGQEQVSKHQGASSRSLYNERCSEKQQSALESQRDGSAKHIQPSQSARSAASKLSRAQLSQISLQKASTISLIQKIYQQMEKIDQHISQKERLDDERYLELERRMKKLSKKYNKVKQENERVQLDGSQTVLSGLPSGRKEHYSQAEVDCQQPLSADKMMQSEGQQSMQKSSSSKPTSRKGPYHRKDYRTSQAAKRGRGKSSIFTESKPTSSAGRPSQRSLISSFKKSPDKSAVQVDDEQEYQVASLQQDQIDIEQAEIDVVGGVAAHESALCPQKSQASALGKDNGAEAALESAHGRTGSVIMVEDPHATQERSYLATEVQDEANDSNQQFPSIKQTMSQSKRDQKRSQQAVSGKDSVLSATVVRTERQTTRQSEAMASATRPQSFGAQYPSIHSMSEARGTDQKIDARSQSVASWSNREAERSRQSFAQQVDLRSSEHPVEARFSHVDCQTSEGFALQRSEQALDGQFAAPGLLSFGQQVSNKETITSGDNYFVMYRNSAEDGYGQREHPAMAEAAGTPLLPDSQVQSAECQSQKSPEQPSSHSYSHRKNEPELASGVKAAAGRVASEQGKSEPHAGASPSIEHRSAKKSDVDHAESDKASRVTMQDYQDQANQEAQDPVLTLVDEVERALTCSSANGPEKNQSQDAPKQAEAAAPTQTEMTSKQDELENQVQMLNGAISQLRDEHQSQIASMKQFYQDQINQMREEFTKREKYESENREGPKPSAPRNACLDTPVAAALKTRVQSISNENLLNLTNLSLSASGSKENKAEQKHAGQAAQHLQVIEVMAPQEQGIYLLTKEVSKTTHREVEWAGKPTAAPQEGETKDALAAEAQQQAELALSKLMDQGKFTETLAQLNKAVGQKEKLEQKLIRLKEKIQAAKNIKNQKREQVREASLEMQTQNVDLSVDCSGLSISDTGAFKGATGLAGKSLSHTAGALNLSVAPKSPAPLDDARGQLEKEKSRGIMTENSRQQISGMIQTHAQTNSEQDRAINCEYQDPERNALPRGEAAEPGSKSPLNILKNILSQQESRQLQKAERAEDRAHVQDNDITNESQMAPQFSQSDLHGGQNCLGRNPHLYSGCVSNMNSASSCKQLLLNAWTQHCPSNGQTHAHNSLASHSAQHNSQINIQSQARPRPAVLIADQEMDVFSYEQYAQQHVPRSAMDVHRKEVMLDGPRPAPSLQLHARPIQSSTGTLESLHPGVQDSQKRGVYQKIIDLQSQQRNYASSSNLNAQELQPTSFRPNPTVLQTKVLQRAHHGIGSGLGVQGADGVPSASLACAVHGNIIGVGVGSTSSAKKYQFSKDGGPSQRVSSTSPTQYLGDRLSSPYGQPYHHQALNRSQQMGNHPFNHTMFSGQSSHTLTTQNTQQAPQRAPAQASMMIQMGRQSENTAKTGVQQPYHEGQQEARNLAAKEISERDASYTLHSSSMDESSPTNRTSRAESEVMSGSRPSDKLEAKLHESAILANVYGQHPGNIVYGNKNLNTNARQHQAQHLFAYPDDLRQNH